MRATMASRTSVTPSPVFAEMRRTLDGSTPMSSATAPACSSGSAAGRSILLSTGISSRSPSIGEIGVGQRLGLDALAGVDDQQRALARRQAAGDLVAEVHVAGGVDQVELVGLPVGGRVEDADRLRLDRDPALALEIHRVEDLLPHVPLGDRAGQLEDAIGQRRLAMVDVGDDAEVSDQILLHSGHRSARTRRVSWLSSGMSTAWAPARNASPAATVAAAMLMS